MGQFNKPTPQRRPDIVTHQGGEGFSREPKEELFLLGVSFLVGNDTFYESADDRMSRFVDLIHKVTGSDEAWMRKFIPWLRQGANIRSASVVAACEYVKAGGDSGRSMISAVCQRPDEPAEVLGYWMSTHGRKIPAAVKRGVADAVVRLYNERNTLRYDGQGNTFRFGDVIELTHPSPSTETQSALFRHLIDRRHGRGDEIAPLLDTLVKDRDLMQTPEADRRGRLSEAIATGWSWERLAGWLPGGMDAEAWECIAKGSSVWLPDGTTAPIEEVVKRQLPVCAYNKAWDVANGSWRRPVDRTVGEVVSTVPTKWIDNGPQEVFAVRLRSGRVVEATADHRWVVRGRSGNRQPRWETTSSLVEGMGIPVPVTLDAFGSIGDRHEGWLIGIMLGDGSMTRGTPAWSGLDDGTLEVLSEIVAKYGCGLKVEDYGSYLRARIVDPRWHQNAVKDFLVLHQVWGLRCELKQLANLPYSRAFVGGVVAGLIDSDGCISGRTVDFTSTSQRLAEQMADMLLRLGVMSTIRRREGQNGHRPQWTVRVSDIRSVRALAVEVDLASRPKAERLHALALMDAKTRRVTTGKRAFGEGQVVWDQIVAIEPAGVKHTYCVEVPPSNLWVVNGVVTGNCVIPNMGAMALTRNLRNFDEKNVFGPAVDIVKTKLTDPEEIRRSRQFPLRFVSAWKATQSTRWADALEQAIGHSVSNVPSLPGRTLILVDVSGSMVHPMTGDHGRRGKFVQDPLMRWEVATAFAGALGQRAADGEIVLFHNGPVAKAKITRAESILRFIESCRKFVGGGTNLYGSLAASFDRHDQVVILTDEQSGYMGYHANNTFDAVSHIKVPIHVFNLAGYQHGVSPNERNWNTVGGLNDACFQLLGLWENHRQGVYPWEMAAE